MIKHISITVFEVETGQIRRTVFCQDIDVQLQVQEGEGYIVGNWDANRYEIVNGQAQQKQDAPPVAPTLASIQQSLTGLVNQQLHTAALARGYDSIISACSYAGAPNPFQEESIAFIQWRATLYTYLYTCLNQIEAGAIAAPSEGEFLAAMPVLNK